MTCRALHTDATIGNAEKSKVERSASTTFVLSTEVTIRDVPMMPAAKAALLEGKKGLIVGIANEQSIAWGCAKAFRALGAELAVTYLNDKAKKYVEPLARELEAPIMLPLDVRTPGQIEAELVRASRRYAASVSTVVTERQAEAFADAGFELFAGRSTRRGHAAAYRCRAFVCALPVGSAGELRHTMDA